MFDRHRFDQRNPNPRFVAPAPLQVADIQMTLKNLEKHGHSIDIAIQKLPPGELYLY
jgi:hypothetical protein